MTWVIDDLRVEPDGDSTCWEAEWRHWIGPKGRSRATFCDSYGKLTPEYPPPLPPRDEIVVPRRRDWVLRFDEHLRYSETEYIGAYEGIRDTADDLFHLSWALRHVERLFKNQSIYVEPDGEMPDFWLDLHRAYASWSWDLDTLANLSIVALPGPNRYDRSYQIPPVIKNHVVFVHNARREVNPMRHYKNRLTHDEIKLLESISPELLDSLGHDPRLLDVATNAFTNVALRLEAEFRALYALQKVEFERALRQSNLVSEPEPNPVPVG